MDSYWNANMDLTGVDPYFNMYGRHRPIRIYQRQYPPVKTVFARESGAKPRVGRAFDSLVGTARSSAGRWFEIVCCHIMFLFKAGPRWMNPSSWKM